MVNSDGVSVSALSEFVDDTIAAPNEMTNATVSLAAPAAPSTAYLSGFGQKPRRWTGGCSRVRRRAPCLPH
jgi:hypothetical protein